MSEMELAPLKTGLTPVYESILKINSTKKVAKKLQGKAADRFLVYERRQWAWRSPHVNSYDVGELS
jgi:hypothetical protein